MAKTETAEHTIDWFGADVEADESNKTTEVQFHGGTFIDADVPRNVRQPDGTVETVMVRKPAPKYLAAKSTTPKSDHIATLTARYKTMREGFRFAPADDKEAWERKMNIALAEMQIARFRQKLANYEARGNTRPEQIDLLKQQIWKWRGQFAELTGQEM